MKTAYVTISVRLTLAWAATLWPPLATGVLGKIVESVATKLATYLAEQSELGAFFYYIDTRVGEQGKEFTEAALSNRTVQKTGTPAEREHAEEILWTKFKAFASFVS